jgi:hypothetical protein
MSITGSSSRISNNNRVGNNRMSNNRMSKSRINNKLA